MVVHPIHDQRVEPEVQGAGGHAAAHPQLALRRPGSRRERARDPARHGGAEELPVSPFYSDMSLAMAAQFNSLVSGDTSPEKVAQTLQEGLTTIVEQGS